MREYLLVIVVAAATTYLSMPLIRAIAIATRAFTPLRERDVHRTPIPRLGGVGLYLGFAAAVLAARDLPYLSQTYTGGQISGAFLGATVVCIVGAMDDIKELDWLTKLAGQVLAAGIMAYKGVQLIAIPFLGTSTVLPTPVLVGITVIVVLVTVNAVNWIDGLDGLCAGVVGIAALAFFVYSYALSHTFNPPNYFSTATFLSAAILGCCIGFLPHNFHPARLFMGDSGAMLLGVLVAAATISVTGNVDPTQVSSDQVTAAILPLAVPLAVLFLPFADMVRLIVTRTATGHKPWQADGKHLHHLMLAIGHGHRRAVLLLYLWAALLAGCTVAFAFIPAGAAWALLAGCIGVASVLTFVESKWSRPQRL